MSAPVQAVIFDMDGLLLDTERIALETWLEATAELGIKAGNDLFVRFIGRPWTATTRLIEEYLEPDDARRILARWPQTFEARVDSDGIPIKAGVAELLDLIDDRQLPMALATSTSRERAVIQLTAAGIANRFRAMATGDEVVRGKPAPDIFLLAAQKLGIAPSSCLALEDSEPGVEAASAAGMRVIMVPDLIKPTASLAARAEQVCRSLIEARQFLCGILPGGL